MNKKIHFFQSIHFKIAIVFVLLLVLTLEFIGAYFVRSLETHNVAAFKEQIQIPFIDKPVADELVKEDTSAANESIKAILADVSSQNIVDVRIIDSKGVIRGTSNANNQAIIGQKTTDTTIKKVIYQNKKEEFQTYDEKKDEQYMVSIEPIMSGSGDSTSVLGVIYVRASMKQVYQEITNITGIFLYASLVAGAIALVMSLIIARAITKPIDEMKKQAIRMSRGDYSGQVRIYGQDELGQLANAVNNLSIRVEEAQDSSEAERRRLDSVLTHMTDGVIATNRRGNVIIINEKASEFLSTTAEEIIGKSILEILNIQDEYTLRSLLENQNEMLLDFSEEGHDLILHVDFSLIQRESGFISGLVCVLHDVTEQQKNERERREFVSNVSHELRTPLTSMRSYIEALNDGAWKDPEIAPSFLKVTQDETDRMIRMINDLLSLSRMDAGNAPMDMELINLNELFNYILDRFDMILQSELQADQTAKKYTIKREFTKRQLWVEADADKMTQVLDNIMNNAVKYSPDGGTITCRLLETHNNVIISISDQGLGIPRKDLKRVFDRFYRVDKARARAQGGTGLGLAISKEVIAAHGGRIWVDSIENKGSTFYIALPYQTYEDEGDLWDEN